MALPVLDGNQSATTLSSVVTGGEHIVAHSVVSLGTTAIANITSAVSGSVVSISNFPATQTIAGTVTANVDVGSRIRILDSNGDDIVVNSTNGALEVSVKNSVTIGSLPAISGTVTANLPQAEAWAGVYDSGNDCIKIELANLNGDILSPSNPLPISGTVTVGNSVTIGSLPTLAPQLPRVTFIDGSGAVTTANTAITVFASSSTRSYLLVQVTTGSAFVNVGATATTVNGINLTAGQGYAWETTIPQGIVSLISTTTSSRYVAKEA